MKKLYLLIVAVFVLAACAPAASASLTGEWGLVSYGSASSPTSADPSIDTSILFDAEKISGNVGCNQFNGGYSLEEDRVVFGPLVSTKMACIGAAGEQESAVLSLFAGATTFSLDGDTLTIASEDGASVVVLARK
ncbi:MAG TPA: META domain-containing protein [Anaerolineales bacterium]|jgi:heat shock protein HslJ|nr:META domain-containing protein [Anaerolineales bacterium]HQX15699.1 META domain-containing protein [Anaerolineales bacterium]